MDTDEIRKNRVIDLLLNRILTNPETDFEPIAENLIQKGILTRMESDKIINGWKEAHGFKYDKQLVALWNMPGFEHLRGPNSKSPSSQSIFVKSDNPDYRTLLAYYVYEYKDLDYEMIGKAYVDKGVLPQIAVDNILHRWRRGLQIRNKKSSTGFIAKAEQWWKSEIKNTGIFFQGLAIAIMFCFAGTLFVFKANVFPEMDDWVKIIMLCLPIGYAAQYYLIKHLLLQDIVFKIHEIQCNDHRYATTKTYEDASDEIRGQDIKLKELLSELQGASTSDSLDRIIVVYVFYILLLVIIF